MNVTRLNSFDRPNSQSLAFAEGRLQKARDQWVMDAAAPLHAPDRAEVSQVVVQNEDVNQLTQRPTEAVSRAAESLKPGGTLLMTTGRAAMYQGDALEQQLREAGFKNFGLVVRERAYVTAEKAIAEGVDEVSPEQSNLLLARTNFAGNPQAHGTVDQAGLKPRYTTTVRGRRMHLSKPFQARGYNAFIGYVEADDGALHARTFYQSKSQGIWRSASGVIGQATFGKGPEGHFESSTNLPAELQQRLSEVSRNSDKAAGDPQAQEVSLYAPLEKLSLSEPSRFDRQVEAKPFGRFERRVALDQYNSIGEPTSFQYDHPGQEPHFEGEPETFKMEHPTRGTLQATAVKSRDGESQYLFLQDSDKRTWLGMVESLSDTNDYGVSRQALKDDSLTHPAIEYVQQAAEPYKGEVVTWDTVYNNLTKQEEVLPGYVDTTAYTHQLPPVRDFLAHQAKASKQ